MSMQICVLTDSLIAGIAEWQRAIDAEGFPLQISDDDPNRNLAARLREEETEISYDTHDFRELEDTYANKKFGRDWTYAVAFTWSSDIPQAIASWMAATSYARATHGVVFDEQEGKLLTPEEAVQIVREIERDRPAMEAAVESFVRQLSPKSPEAAAAIAALMQRRSKQSG